MTMFNSAVQCFYLHQIENESLAVSVLVIAGIVVAVYSIIANICALIGIWKVHKDTLTRTPKLLLMLFSTNILSVLAVASFPVYSLIGDCHQRWFFSVHTLVIAFFILWSPTNVCLVTIDRYLIVKHGSQYRFWKNHFQALVVIELLTVASFSVFIYIALKSLGCTVNVINLTCTSVFTAVNMVISYRMNVLLSRYLHVNVSLADRVHNLGRDIAKLVANITVIDGIAHLALICTVTLYIIIITISSPLTQYSNAVLFALPMLCNFTRSTSPLYYVLKNRRIYRVLHCNENSLNNISDTPV